MDIDFSPEKSLFSLPIVRWCAGLSALIAIAVTITIIFSLRHLPFDFTASGFNYFTDQFKVPAALLAIGFTLVGLCSANHRSEQTKKQIERTSSQIALTNNQITLTREQNIFANHYKHLEEFEKFLKILHEKEVANLARRKEYFINNKIFAPLAKTAMLGAHMDQERYRDIYKAIYPQSKFGNFESSSDYRKSLHNFTCEVLSIYSEILTTNPILLSNNILTLNEKIIYFKDSKFITINHETSSSVKIKNNIINVPYGNFKFIFEEAFDAALLINKILSFDFDYNEPEEIKIISTLIAGENLPDLETEEYDENSSTFRMKGMKMNKEDIAKLFK